MTTDYNKKSEEAKKNDKVVNMKKDEPKAPDARPKVKPVAHAKKQKQSLGKRFSKAVLGPDGLPSIGHYLTQDVLLPAIKEIVVNSVTSGINMMMYGQEGANRRNTTNYSQRYSGAYRANRTNYGSNYRSSNQGQSNNTQPYRKESRAGNFSSEDYVLEDRNEALDVMTQLQDQIENYGWASLADFFDLVGIDTNYTDNNYGWTDLEHVTVAVTRGGYCLRLPRLEPLKG